MNKKLILGLILLATIIFLGVNFWSIPNARKREGATRSVEHFY